jgi:hypothetical protein
MIRKAGPDHLTTCTKRSPKIEQFSQLGGVAQLGERTVRIRKVESSILFVSTKKTAKSKDLAVFYNFFDKIEGLRTERFRFFRKMGNGWFAFIQF